MTPPRTARERRPAALPLLTTLSALVAGLLTLSLLAPGTARADETTGPSGRPAQPGSTDLPQDPTEGRDTKDVTVGLQPATADGPDARASYEFRIKPEGVVQDYVAVFNYSERPVRALLTPRDATSSADVPFTVQPNGEKATDVGAWISLPQDRLKLKPRSMTLVPMQVGVPYDATPGEHVGAVVLTILSRKQQDGQSVVVQNRVGLRVYLTVPGDLDASLEITDLTSSFDGRWASFGLGRSTVQYTVRNTGNLSLSASQTVAVLRTMGLPTVNVPVPGTDLILPGGERSFRVVSEDHLGLGRLTTEVVVRPVSGRDDVDVDAVSARVEVMAIPWALILTILTLIALLVLWLRWRQERRRRVRASGDPGIGGGGPGTDGDAPDAPRDPAPDAGALVGRHALATRSRRGRPRRGSARAGALLAAAMLLSGLGLGLGAGQASADEPPVWQAEVSPAKGTDDEPLDVVTSGGCPAPGTNAITQIFGKGFPASGYNVVGNTAAGIEPRARFRMPLFTTLKMFMFEQPEPVAFEGTYRLVTTCVRPEGVGNYGQYVVALRFTDAHSWVMAPPLTEAQGPHGGAVADPGAGPQPPSAGTGGSTGGSTGAPSDPGASGSDGGPGASGDPGSSSASGAPGEPSRPDDPSQPGGPGASSADPARSGDPAAGAESADDGGMATGSLLAIAAGVLVLLASAALVLKDRRA